MAHQVFISYGHQDKLVADATCARLEARGIRCWIAPRDVLPGLAYGEAINTAIRGCRALVLVFSSNANLSDHVSKEVERAVSNGIPVVPLRIENVTPTGALEYFIGSVHWLDALTQPIDEHLERLAESVQRLLGAEPPRRPPPIPGPLPVPKPMGLYIALVAVAVIALGALWFLLGRPAEPQRPTASASAVADPAPQVTVPQVTPEKPTEPSRIATNAAPERSAPAERGISGCWFYNNLVNLRMEKDGRITGSPLLGNWRAEGGNSYSITWVSPVDTVQISPDGGSLSGSNNYGPAISAQRMSLGTGGPQDFSGTWHWSNGATVIASAGGAVATGPVQGRWSSVGGSAYKIDWKMNPVDQLTLSADGRTVSGQNNFGVAIAGTRTACAN